MANPNEDWESIFAALERLRGRWPAPDWMYDRRLKCVASSIPLAREAEARAAMAEALPLSFSVGDAARRRRRACGRSSKSAAGCARLSLLFWGGGDDAAGAFGLWWPWGDGTTVSLRIGLHDVDIPKERYPRLRDVFGIPQAHRRLMMRLACLFFASAVSFAPIGANAAGAAHAADAAKPAKTKSTPKKSAKKKPAARKRRSVPSRRWPARLRPGALTVNVGHEINEDAHVTPFPSFAGHAQKALAQNRRDQLIDAEQAARAARQPDRWMTVLFHLRELDSRNDPEACFWRVVAYYRLGELARARALRASCEPPPAVQAVLDNEDACRRRCSRSPRCPR